MELKIIENKDDYTSIKIPDNCEVTIKNGLINIEKSIQDGDFVFIETAYCDVVAIFKSYRDDKSAYYYARVMYPKDYSTGYNDWCRTEKIRKATKEEKETLINALIKENKYWDASSKSIKIIPEKNKFYTITNKSGTIDEIFINKSFDLSSTPVCLNAYASYSVDIYALFDTSNEEVLIDEGTDVIVCTSLLSTSFFSEYTIKEADPLEIRTFLSAMSKKGYTWDFKNEKIVKINHFWQPSIGERYYYISSDLTLVRNMYRDSGFDRILQKNGSCFKTVEAAENCLQEIKKLYKKINTI